MTSNKVLTASRLEKDAFHTQTIITFTSVFPTNVHLGTTSNAPMAIDHTRPGIPEFETFFREKYCKSALALL